MGAPSNLWLAPSLISHRSVSKFASTSSQVCLMHRASRGSPRLRARVQTAAAWSAARDQILETELTELKTEYPGKLLLKREDRQHGFSFHIRAATNLLQHLCKTEESGVVVASTGNAAIAVAQAAHQMALERSIKISVTAVLPHTSSTVKVQMIRQLGAQVLFHGASLAESAKEAEMIAARSSALLLPFNLGDIAQLCVSSDAMMPLALAGYGTIALEILRQLGKQDPPDAVFVPCHSGALLAGISVFMHRISPSTRIVGVTTRPNGPPATRILPGETLRLIEMYADGVVSVDDGEIASAIRSGCSSNTLAIVCCSCYICEREREGERETETATEREGPADSLEGRGAEEVLEFEFQ